MNMKPKEERFKLIVRVLSFKWCVRVDAQMFGLLWA